MARKNERRPYQPIIGGTSRVRQMAAETGSPSAAAIVPRKVFQRVIGWQRQPNDHGYANHASEPPQRGPEDTAEFPRIRRRPIDSFRRRWERRDNRRHITLERKSPQGWRATVIPQRGRVPEEDLRHCQSLLVEDVGGHREDVIYYLSRYHPFKSIERVTPAIFALFLGVIIFFGSLAKRVSGSYGYTDAKGQAHMIMDWYWPPVIGAVLIVCGAIGYYFLRYGWRYQFIMLTNNKLRLLNEFPPKKSLILGNKVDNNDLNRIESVDIDQDRWGKVFNYGNLKVTLVGSDPEKPKVLEKVADPFKIAALIESVCGAHHRAPRDADDLTE